MFASQFENEEKSFRNKKTTVSVVVTVLIHALLLLFLIFTILHTPMPPFADNAGGMSVNYGTDETGSGDIQPFTYNPGPTEAALPSAPSASEPVTSSSEDVLSDEKSEVVVVKSEDKPKRKVNEKAVFKKNTKPVKTESTKPANTEVVNPVPVQKANPNALFNKGAYGKPNNSKGDGQGGPQGDQGKPDGDPNSRNYQGDPGTGDGPGSGGPKGGFSLKGRKKVGLPAPGQCGSQGRVVMAIKVDRTGKVTEATFKRFESTVYDDCNKTNAHNAAMKATFNPDPNAPEIQEGTITYIYKVN